PAPSKGGPVGLPWRLAVCASCSNNLAQELAWDRWKKCGDYPGLSLNSIDRDGEIWVRFADGASDRDLEPWRARLRQGDAEAGGRGARACGRRRRSRRGGDSARAEPRVRPRARRRHRELLFTSRRNGSAVTNGLTGGKGPWAMEPSSAPSTRRRAATA